MYQCGRCGLTRASGQEIGVIQKCKCPWEFVPPASPQRTWVGLTEDEAFACKGRDYFETYQAIEAKLKEKNT